MRQIDADALKSALWESWGYNSLVAEICEFVDKQPTVDSVTVVRCGMCKHWTACESEENDCDIYGVCNQIGRLTIYDWFCADGERR